MYYSCVSFNFETEKVEHKKFSVFYNFNFNHKSFPSSQLNNTKTSKKCFGTTRSCRYTTFLGLSLGRLRMEATNSRKISRNYKYPYFDPTTRKWNIDTNIIHYFEFVNYLNNNHNRKDTLYLIFEYIPKLNQDLILPITIDNNFAIVSDNSKLNTKNLMPKYIAVASQLKDVSVNIFEINQLINIYGISKFKKMDIYNQQLLQKDNHNKKMALKQQKQQKQQKQKQKKLLLTQVNQENNTKKNESNTNDSLMTDKKENIKKNSNDIDMKSNIEDGIDSSSSTISDNDSKNNNDKNENKNNSNNQGEICINLSKYTTNTNNASNPKPFASNDFISKIVNYKWYIKDETKNKSRTNIGPLEIYNAHRIAFSGYRFFNHNTQE